AAVRCEAVTWPEGGFVTCDQAPADLAFGSRCDFGCSEGYVLDGPSSIECTAQGEWSEPAPKCKGAFSPPPQTGACVCSSGSVAECPLEPVSGQRALLRCLETSIPLGSWLPVKLCAVLFVQCEPLSSPEKGSMDCSHGAGNFTYSAACHFSCLEGWRLNGSHVLECSRSGNWSASLPTCEAAEQVSYVSVGIAATSASLLSTASFLLWLAR
ncbi:E-selectin, partial [Buceros rhinoceros silvestris]